MEPLISNVQGIQRYEAPKWLIQPERSPSDWETISEESEGYVVLENPVVGYGMYNAIIRVTYSNGDEYDYLAAVD